MRWGGADGSAEGDGDAAGDIAGAGVAIAGDGDALTAGFIGGSIAGEADGAGEG